MIQSNLESILKQAIAHHEANELPQAEALYRQVLAQNPNHADALHLMGVIAHQVNRNDKAAELILHAININPREAAYYSNLGEAYRNMGMTEPAMGAYRQAIAVNSSFPEAYSNLGNVLCEVKRYEEARETCLKAIALKPGLPQAWNNLGNAHEELGEPDKAQDAYRKALSIDPKFAKAYSNMGHQPPPAGQKYKAARDAYNAGIAADNSFADTHWNRSLILLLTGDYDLGWSEYEWRWKSRDFPSPIRNFPEPLYTGQDLTGKKILLYAEQGFGDTIQFVRYAQMLVGKAERVYMECQPELFTLFQSIPGLEVITQGSPLPKVDVQAPLLTLPFAFKTNEKNIPADVPYLFAKPEALAKWRDILPRDKLNIGLAWAGRPTHREDKRRSLKLTAFAPLFDIPGLNFVSLQKEPAGKPGSPIPA